MVKMLRPFNIDPSYPPVLDALAFTKQDIGTMTELPQIAQPRTGATACIA
jgi:hypothetical protein